jgi:RNA-directed DNA polymerase
MLAALGNGVRGGKWHSLIDKVYAPSTLRAAWERVAANAGAAGVDRISIERFEAKAASYLAELTGALQDGSYRPEPLRRVQIPKGKGQTRPLGIATVKDRVVQTALKLVLEPIFEKEFLPASFGFRPGRGCKDALRIVDRALKDGYTWVVDADLQSYFDTIPRQPLVALVKDKVSDVRVLELVERFLEQDVMEGLKRWTPVAGTPQGSVISPLMSNVYLHDLDRLMSEAGYPYVRFADDFVALCRTQQEAETVLAMIQAWVAQRGLRLHPDKTRVGHCMEKGQGFEFLGYRFEAGRRWVRSKSLKALRDKIRDKTGRNTQRSPGDHHWRAQSDPKGLVWILQASPSHKLPGCGRLRASTTARHSAQAREASGVCSDRQGSSSLAKCLLRRARAFHPTRSLCSGEPIPMR